MQIGDLKMKESKKGGGLFSLFRHIEGFEGVLK